jgi:hypothetical protein
VNTDIAVLGAQITTLSRRLDAEIETLSADLHSQVKEIADTLDERAETLRKDLGNLQRIEEIAKGLHDHINALSGQVVSMGEEFEKQLRERAEASQLQISELEARANTQHEESLRELRAIRAFIERPGFWKRLIRKVRG